MSTKRKIIFFVPSMVHVLDLTGPIQVFYEANSYGADYELDYVALKANPVSAAGCDQPIGNNKLSIDGDRLSDRLFRPESF